MRSLTCNQKKKPTTTKPQYLASSALSEYFYISFLSNFKGKWTAALCLLWRWGLKKAACTIIPDPAKMPVSDLAGPTELLGAEGSSHGAGWKKMVNVVHKITSPEKGFTRHEKMPNPHQLPFRLKTSVWCWKAAASFFPQLRSWTTSFWQLQVSAKHTIPFITWDLVQRSLNAGGSGNKCLMMNFQGKHVNISECLKGPEFLFY